MMTKARVIAVMLCISIVLSPTPLLACTWDYDTLAMERAKFPTALELITGKFIRHSPEFYEWRVQDRLARLESEPDNLALYDDLGVAYDKMGQHDKAIAMILEKEKRSPGLYETYANLGTFYVHSGELEQGVEYIDKAIEINPDAHFGRDIYQKHLLEYILGRRVLDPGTRSLSFTNNLIQPGSATGFARHVMVQTKNDEEIFPGNLEEDPELMEHALKGILGMMRFGNHQSPALLEAAGDLLIAQGNHDKNGLQRLAARAYLMAGMPSQNEGAKQKYREKAEYVLQTQSGEHIDLIETALLTELEEAEEWYAAVAADEARWISEGSDVDAKFSAKYYEDPKLIGPIGEHKVIIAVKSLSLPQILMLILTALGIILIVVGTGLVLITRKLRGASHD